MVFFFFCGVLEGLETIKEIILNEQGASLTTTHQNDRDTSVRAAETMGDADKRIEFYCGPTCMYVCVYARQMNRYANGTMALWERRRKRKKKLKNAPARINFRPVLFAAGRNNRRRLSRNKLRSRESKRAGPRNDYSYGLRRAIRTTLAPRRRPFRSSTITSSLPTAYDYCVPLPYSSVERGKLRHVFVPIPNMSAVCILDAATIIETVPYPFLSLCI